MRQRAVRVRLRYVQPSLAAVHTATETLSSPRRRRIAHITAGQRYIRPKFGRYYGDPMSAPHGRQPIRDITLVMAREPIPAAGAAVFLAGPTPRLGGEVPSWRPAAVNELATQWAGTQPLTVLSPESRDGKRAEHYDDQVDWETDARARATAILFWIPRDMTSMPGMTTNIEFGLDVGTGRAVLGCPPDCPNPERNRYLIYVARRHGVPVCETLADTVAAALAIVEAHSPSTSSPAQRSVMV